MSAVPMSQYSRLQQVKAAQDKRIAELEAEWRRECDDADKIMEKIGLTIEQARTDGGSLKVAFICNHIQETLDALAATRALQIDTVNKMVRLERENAELRMAAAGARQVLLRYRNETPIGRQPHMIAHVADKAIEDIDAAIASEKENERG